MKEIVNTQKIIEYIDVNNLTKTDFCKLCKISISTFNRILSGKDFYLATLFKIAKIMQVNVCNLFNTK